MSLYAADLPPYADRLALRVAETRAAFGPDHRDDNWIGLAFLEHEEGTCLQCDAYRVLQREEDERTD